MLIHPVTEITQVIRFPGFDRNFYKVKQILLATPITGGGTSGAKSALQEARKTLYSNRDANQNDLNRSRKCDEYMEHGQCLGSC